MATLLLIRHGQASYGEADYDRLSARGHDQARALGRHLQAARLDALYAGPLRRQAQTAALAVETAGGALPAPTTLDELAEYPAFELLHRFLPRLVAEDPAFAALATLGRSRPSASGGSAAERGSVRSGDAPSALPEGSSQLTSAPSRELLDRAFHTILGRWSRDEWAVEGVERVTAFAARVRTGLERVIAAAAPGARLGVVTSAGPIGVAVGLVFGATEHHMVRTSIVVRNASITELKFRTESFAWHPEQISLVTFNQTHHLPPELHTEY